MEVYRPFSPNCRNTSNVNVRPVLIPKLFVKVGTRVGVITVYCEHMSKNLPCTVPSVANKEVQCATLNY